jgi:hypothetical protein
MRTKDLKREVLPTNYQYVPSYLYIYGYTIDVVVRSNYTASNVIEKYIGKGLDRLGYDLNWRTIRILPGQTEDDHDKIS